MNASQLIDALSVSFFALLGIWAAVVRRHWFVRLAAVGGVLLWALLIPAHEIVVQFGSLIALIMAGVWLARDHKNWRPRVSLETALLSMVVVAVATAVMARMHSYDLAQWLDITNVSLGASYVALLCLWVVCGRSRLRWRILGGVGGLIIFVIAFHFGGAALYAIRQTGNGRDWKHSFTEYYNPAYIGSWLGWILPTLGVCVTIVLAVVTLARATRWFDSPSKSEVASPSRRAVAARWALSVTMLVLASPLVCVFYRLLTPPPLIMPALPRPNGHDDFLAAAREAPAPLHDVDFQMIRGLSRAPLRAYFDLAEPVASRIAAGVRKECWTLHPFPNVDDEARSADLDLLRRDWAALAIRLMYLRRYGAASELADAELLQLRYLHEVTRGGVEMQQFECNIVFELRRLIGRLTAAECRSLAAELADIDRRRDPLEARISRQKIVEANRGWDAHLGLLLAEWSGAETIPGADWARGYVKAEIAETRLVILAAALQAYYLERDSLPPDLGALVPDYLAEIPKNPVDDRSFGYERIGRRFKIYSYGWDNDDDDGNAPAANSADGDSIVWGPQTPLTWIGETAKGRILELFDEAQRRLKKLLLPRTKERRS